MDVDGKHPPARMLLGEGLPQCGNEAAAGRAGRSGAGTLLLLHEREKPGFLCFRNSYWALTLFSPRGRAFPALPLLLYMAYAAIVTAVVEAVGAPDDKQSLAMTRLIQAADTVPLLAAELPQQCSISALAGRRREVSRLLRRGQEHGPHNRGLAVQCGYLHLRNDDLATSTALRELLGPEGAREVAAAADPVLLCLYRMLAVDSKYEKWRYDFARGCDYLYTDYNACRSVKLLPMPFAHLAHLRTFLVLWLLAVPIPAAVNYGWWSLLLDFSVAWGILGVEEAAAEVEQPFG